MGRSGTVLALLVVAGYFAFEIYAASRAAYRTEPLYIFDQFAAAARATEVCGALDPENQERGVRNLAIVRAKAMRDLRAKNPDAGDQEIERMAVERAEAQARHVDTLIGAKGCQAPEVRAHQRRFAIYARKNLG